MHIVHGVTRTEINLSSKKTFSQLQTGQGYLKYRSNLKNVLPTPYIFLLGGGEGRRRSKDRRNNTCNQLLYFYFYNILSHLKKMYAASKIIFTQLCFSSCVNLCCHKNSIYFNDNYRHVKVGRPGKKHFAPVFHPWQWFFKSFIHRVFFRWRY